MKKECQPDETINSMINETNRGHDDPKKSWRKFVDFILVYSFPFSLSAFVAMPVVAVKSTQKYRWYITIFSSMLCYASNLRKF